ncbi:MAG: hypothetical protein SVU32_00205 [Candidatus Nanohaloarchaea archaeon]|nr:hypothetical protein [Candidatus Nanohaloarchaea archaeon]
MSRPRKGFSSTVKIVVVILAVLIVVLASTTVLRELIFGTADPLNTLVDRAIGELG